MPEVIGKLMSNVDVQIGGYNYAQGGRVDFFPQFPTYVDTVAVTGTSTTWTKPTGTKWVIFSASPGLSFAARKDAVAVYPTASVTDGTGSLLNPAQMDVSGVTTLGIIGNLSAPLSIACYA